MELRQLRYFVALAEELHYGAAAERLRISKPTLSQQVAVLERSLGVQLVDRTRRAVSLTPAGAVLRDEARRVLADCDRMRLAVSTAAAGQATIDVRVVHGIDRVLESRLEALQQHPDLRVDLTTTSGLDAEEAVVSGRADAALIWLFSGTHTTLHVERVGSSPLCLAVPATSHLAALDVVPVGELRGQRIALFPRRLGPAMWDLFVEHLLPDGPAPGQLLEQLTGALPMVGMMRAVAEGRAVAPFVELVGELVAPEGVVLRPLSPPLELPIHLVCREPTRSDLAQLLSVLRP